MSCQGVARATAIGIAYGAYGAATGAAPVLLQLIPGVWAPAFVAAIAACAGALWPWIGGPAGSPRASPR